MTLKTRHGICEYHEYDVGSPILQGLLYVPPAPSLVVEFCFVFWKKDLLACNNFSKLQLSFHHYRETKKILHTRWSSLQNTQQNSTNFSAMLGDDEKIIRKKIHTKMLNSA